MIIYYINTVSNIKLFNTYKLLYIIFWILVRKNRVQWGFKNRGIFQRCTFNPNALQGCRPMRPIWPFWAPGTPLKHPKMGSNGPKIMGKHENMMEKHILATLGTICKQSRVWKMAFFFIFINFFEKKNAIGPNWYQKNPTPMLIFLWAIIC